MISTIMATLLGMAAAPRADVAPWAAWLRGFALQGPQVELWTDRNYGTVYHRGDRVRVFFRTDEDAYVTVMRVDADGRVRVLFPADPWEDNFARGGRAYEVRPGYDRYAFAIEEYPGEGYVFAIATRDPFDYRTIVRADHWDYRVIANNGRVTGDPYVAMQDLVDLIVPATYESYGYDVTNYYVEQYYEYPRFLCYDCHSYVAYPYWDPYHYSCFRFRIVVYDDPYYYPARAYSATRVVYRRATRIEPRYVFTDRTPAEPYVVRVRQRPTQPAPRRADERGVTGRDVGGVGTIPAPVTREPAGRVRLQPGTGNAAPTRRPDVQMQPLREPQGLVPGRRTGGESTLGPGRQPQRTETPPQAQPAREPGGRALPDRRTVPQVPQPREVVPPEPSREPERPRLERRTPPQERQPATRPEPQRPATQAGPPAVQPKVPAKQPATPQKKPGGEPKPRKPGG